MRIAILAHNLRVAGGLSVGLNIVSSLARVGSQHDYLLVLPAGVGYEAGARPARSECAFFRRRWGSLGQAWFNEFTLPRLVRSFQPDVVWALGNYGLARPGAPQAILIHQPQLVYDPREQKTRRWSMTRSIRYVRRQLERSLPATQLVFCQTRTMATRFERVFGALAPAARVELLPNAVSEHVMRGAAPADALVAGGEPSAPPAVAEQPRVPPAVAERPGKFVLFALTRYYPHKNLELLADAFGQFREALRGVVVLLTIARTQHRGAARLLDRIERENLGEHLVNVGPLAQSELAAYYAHCGALVLPTVLESFSGTYVEAMRLGCPILTSDMDFAREVCGDAAIYFDPSSPAGLRDAILRLRDGGAALRAALADLGRRQLAGMANQWDPMVAAALGKLTGIARVGTAHPTNARASM